MTWRDIKQFIDSRDCTKGGKRAYFNALRSFYRWLYSPRSELGLDPRDNPVLFVDPPKKEKKILPSLTVDQVAYLIEQAECTRDRAIISLFADSGLRLTELANIMLEDINWESRLIKVKCKGNKEAYAVFGERTELVLKQWLAERWLEDEYLWDVRRWGISHILRDLRAKTGLPCNAHTFRRTFASILAKRGVDSLHIMRLGRWECIAMVEHYTRSVKFEDSLRFYQAVL
jgi:site-specific recombinase XerD